jgi:serine/threonine protein kinase
LIHQGSIKLADLGLSKRIEEASTNSRIFGLIPYIDPKRFSKRKYPLNEKSDVYSVGVLLWEISSGLPPFYVEGEQYDVGLIYEILKGLRETNISGTPKDYVKIYTGKYNSYIND